MAPAMCCNKDVENVQHEEYFVVTHLLGALPTWISDLPSPWSDLLLTLLSPAVLGGLTLASVILFVLTAVGLPWMLARVPADYFSKGEASTGDEATPAQVWWRRSLRVARNLVGAILLLAGFAMLVLPGQGLLTIFAALFLLDVPGKRRLQRRLVRNDAVFRGLNALRRRMGAAPFLRGPFPPPSTR